MPDQQRAGSVGRDELDVSAHDGTRRVIPIGPKGMTIGRAPGNDLVLDHPSVSRQHARLEFDGTDYRVVDLGSTNGTLLGEIRLLPAVPQVWTPDRILTIGANKLRLRRAAAPAPAAASPDALSRLAPSIMPGSLAHPGSERSRVGLFMDTQDVSVEAGGSTTVLITILNQGALVDHFQISVSGIPAPWVHIAAESIRLLPGVSQDIPIVFMPPRTPQSRAGPHGITIQARSRDAPDQFSQVIASLNVQPFYQFDLEIRPRRRTSMTSGRFQLLVTNQGNAELTLDLGAVDPEELGLYTFQPRRAAVPAGQTHTVQLEVRSQDSTLHQTATAMPFTVTARPVEAPETIVQAQGEWVQSPPVYELELRPQSQRGTRQGAFSLHIANSSDGALTVELSAFDPEEACTYSFSPHEIVAPPGQERVVQLRVRPRTTLPGSEPRRIPFTISARAAEAPLVTRQAQGEWTQVPPEFTVAAQPQDSSGIAEGSFTLELSNRSDSELTVSLTATDPAGGCQFTFDSPAVALAPGRTNRVHLMVRPKVPSSSPEPITHQVTVTARPSEFPGVHRQAQMHWTQLPPVDATPEKTRRQKAARAPLPKETKPAGQRQRRIPIWLWLLIGLIVIAVAAVVLMGGSGDSGRPTPDKPPEEPGVQPGEAQSPSTRTPSPAMNPAAPHEGAISLFSEDGMPRTALLEAESHVTWVRSMAERLVWPPIAPAEPI